MSSEEREALQRDLRSCFGSQGLLLWIFDEGETLRRLEKSEGSEGQGSSLRGLRVVCGLRVAPTLDFDGGEVP